MVNIVNLYIEICNCLVTAARRAAAVERYAEPFTTYLRTFALLPMLIEECFV